MNRRGIALIISYMVIGVLAVLGVALVGRSISERYSTQRYVNSTKAFWLAEAGIARAIKDFSDSPLSGYLEDTNNTYDTQTSLVEGFTDRYRIISTGTVTLSTGGTITRTIQVIVQEPQPGDIDNAVTSTGDIVVGGAATINPEGSEAPFSVFSFEETFGMSESKLRAQADHFYLDPDNNVLPVDGITWIELSAGDELVISQNSWDGSGILVVNGDLKITGGSFNGILWVNGGLEVSSGNPDIFGAIFVNCGEEDTVVLGNAEITHDPDVIEGALSSMSPFVLSWSEL